MENTKNTKLQSAAEKAAPKPTKLTKFTEAALWKAHNDSSRDQKWMHYQDLKAMYSCTGHALRSLHEHYGVVCITADSKMFTVYSQPMIEHVLTHAKELHNTSAQNPFNRLIDQARDEAIAEAKREAKEAYAAKLAAV